MQLDSTRSLVVGSKAAVMSVDFVCVCVCVSVSEGERGRGLFVLYYILKQIADYQDIMIFLLILLLLLLLIRL